MDVVNAGTTSRSDRLFRRSLALIGAGALGLSLTGCSLFGVRTVAPQPSPTEPTIAQTSATPSATATPTVSATPTVAVSSPTASKVKATGNLNFYAEVSSAMTGTCAQVDGKPTITVTDESNDFYQTVSMTIVLTSAKDRLSSFAVETGEDGEEITWHLGYDAAKPAKGTSAKLVVNGSTYRVSGNTTVVEIDADGAKTTEVIPFGATVKCASLDW